VGDDLNFQASFRSLDTGAPSAFYQPVNISKRTKTAFLFMHPDANFIDHLGCNELAKRGHSVLGVNTRFANMPGPTGGPYSFHDVLEDVQAAVDYLRSCNGIESVVLAGHSGGGPLFAAYQNLAENGFGVLQGPELISKVPAFATDIPMADAIVLLDAHLGYGSHALFTLDASMTDEAHPSQRDVSLDMFNPGNGFGVTGTHYSREFVTRYAKAQSERMNKLVEFASWRLSEIQAGNSEYPDDEPLVVPGMGMRLWSPDIHLLAQTKGEWKLLCGDGSTRVEVVKSVRPPSGDPVAQRSYGGGVLATSIRKFLATQAIRSFKDYDVGLDFLSGVDWHSSVTSAPANLEGVSVPLLSLVMTGHYFLVPDEINFSHANSIDKEMAMVEGATHSFMPCKATEEFPGAFGDTVGRAFDYVDQWVRARF